MKEKSLKISLFFIFLIGIFFTFNLNIKADDGVSVTNSSDFSKYLADDSTQTINLKNDISVNSSITIGAKSSLKINGNGYKLDLQSNQLSSVNKQNITFSNLTMLNNSIYGARGNAYEDADYGLIKFNSSNNSTVNVDDVNFYGGTLLSSKRDSNVTVNFNGTGSLNSYVSGDITSVPNVIANKINMQNNSYYHMTTYNGNCVVIPTSTIDKSGTPNDSINLKSSSHLKLNPNHYGATDASGDDTGQYAGIYFSYSTRGTQNAINEDENSKLEIDTDNSSVKKGPDSEGVTGDRKLSCQAVYKHTLGSGDELFMNLNKAEYLATGVKNYNDRPYSFMRNYNSGIRFSIKNMSTVSLDTGERVFRLAMFYTRGITFNADSFSTVKIDNDGDSNPMFRLVDGGGVYPNAFDISDVANFEVKNGQNGSLYSGGSSQNVNYNFTNGGYFWTNDASGKEISQAQFENKINYDIVSARGVISNFKATPDTNGLTNKVAELTQRTNYLRVANPVVTLYYVDENNNILNKKVVKGSLGQKYSEIDEIQNPPKEINLTNSYGENNSYRYASVEGNQKDGIFGLNDDKIIYHYNRIHNELTYLNPSFEKINFLSNGPLKKGKFLKSVGFNSEELGISFDDKRTDKNPISVSLEQTNKSFTKDSDGLSGELYFKNNDESKDLYNNQTKILTNYDPKNNFYWKTNNQILFKPDNDYSKTKNTNYTSKNTLSWTITNGIS